MFTLILLGIAFIGCIIAWIIVIKAWGTLRQLQSREKHFVELRKGNDK